jgi:hypothetical protein
MVSATSSGTLYALAPRTVRDVGPGQAVVVSVSAEWARYAGSVAGWTIAIDGALAFRATRMGRLSEVGDP